MAWLVAVLFGLTVAIAIALTVQRGRTKGLLSDKEVALGSDMMVMEFMLRSEGIAGSKEQSFKLFQQARTGTRRERKEARAAFARANVMLARSPERRAALEQEIAEKMRRAADEAIREASSGPEQPPSDSTADFMVAVQALLVLFRLPVRPDDKPRIEALARDHETLMREHGATGDPRDYAERLVFLPGLPIGHRNVKPCGCCLAPFEVDPKIGTWIAKGRKQPLVPLCAVCVEFLNRLYEKREGARPFAIPSGYDPVGVFLVQNLPADLPAEVAPVRELAVVRKWVATRGERNPNKE
jgi:hypothetical protein